MSTYYVEAPSAFNGLLVIAEHQSDDPRQKRCPSIVRPTPISITLHTCWKQPSSVKVCHWLKKEKPSGKQLNSIMKVLTDFWGDAIEIDDDQLDFQMRQTTITWDCIVTYSAGLVISCFAGVPSFGNSETGAGGSISLNRYSKTPPRSAMIIGADISTDKPLSVIRFSFCLIQLTRLSPTVRVGRWKFRIRIWAEDDFWQVTRKRRGTWDALEITRKMIRRENQTIVEKKFSGCLSIWEIPLQKFRAICFTSL